MVFLKGHAMIPCLDTTLMPDLCVNIDHVATVRQARRTWEPDPAWAAVEAQLGAPMGSRSTSVRIVAIFRTMIS